MIAALDMVKKHIQRNVFGYPRYKGNHHTIGHTIIRKCYTGKYFKVSAGHFQEFYIRDFTLCLPALLHLGYHDQSASTIRYALERYCHAKKITARIRNGKPLDFLSPASDSVPYLIRSLQLLINHPQTRHIGLKLRKKYLEFLTHQLHLFGQWIEPSTGIIRRELRLSSIKDHHRSISSCYDNAMAGMVAIDTNTLKLPYGYKTYDYSNILKEYYYNGSYFEHDICNSTLSAPDNIFPFYSGVITNTDMAKSCIRTMQINNLDDPFPIKYTLKRDDSTLAYQWLKWIAPNYEGTTIWMHLGLCYLYIIHQHTPHLLTEYLESYSILINRHKNFLEVYNSDTTPYRSLLYSADDSMIWIAMYLHLLDINASAP